MVPGEGSGGATGYLPFQSQQAAVKKADDDDDEDDEVEDYE